MPELPEVETIRRHLQEYVEGAIILEVQDLGNRFHLPSLSGRKISRLFRHGKCLFFEFPEKDALFVHLGMTGKLLLTEKNEAFPHQHLIVRLSSGVFLSFSDQRKFGKVRYLTEEEKQMHIQNLGIDPLSPAYRFELVVKLFQSPRRIKDFLLDQRKIAGIGNIYASEILFQSRIHPERKLVSLSAHERHMLFETIPAVLQEAIRCQGTTIRDFTSANGQEGTFQDCLSVYGKAGQPCPLCHRPIQKKVIGSRSTYFCPHCQH